MVPLYPVAILEARIGAPENAWVDGNLLGACIRSTDAARASEWISMTGLCIVC